MIEEIAGEATDAMIGVTIEERKETETAGTGVDRQESQEVLEEAEMTVEDEIENATTEIAGREMLDEGERVEALTEGGEGKAGEIRETSYAIDLGQESECAILARGTTGAPGEIETEM